MFRFNKTWYAVVAKNHSDVQQFVWGQLLLSLNCERFYLMFLGFFVEEISFCCWDLWLKLHYWRNLMRLLFISSEFKVIQYHSYPPLVMNRLTWESKWVFNLQNMSHYKPSILKSYAAPLHRTVCNKQDPVTAGVHWVSSLWCFWLMILTMLLNL